MLKLLLYIKKSQILNTNINEFGILNNTQLSTKLLLSFILYLPVCFTNFKLLHSWLLFFPHSFQLHS